MLTPQQLSAMVHERYTFSAAARGYYLRGDDGRAQDCAAIARHAHRRIRAHVRERRRRLRAVMARCDQNIIGRMVAEAILRGEMSTAARLLVDASRMVKENA